MRLKTIVEVRQKFVDEDGRYIQREPPIPEGVQVELYGVVSLVPYGIPLDEFVRWFGGIVRGPKRHWSIRWLLRILRRSTTVDVKIPSGHFMVNINQSCFVKTLLNQMPIQPSVLGLSKDVCNMVVAGHPRILRAGDVIETRVRSGDGKFHEGCGVGLVVVQCNGENMKGASR
jgi:hypothetical protein